MPEQNAINPDTERATATPDRNRGILGTIRRRLLPTALALGLASSVGAPAPQNRMDGASINQPPAAREMVPPADAELIPLAKGVPRTTEIPLAQPVPTPGTGQQTLEKIPKPKIELIPLAKPGDDQTELIPLAKPAPTDNYRET